MNKKSFLEFDISVSADKKRRSKRSSISGGFEASTRACQVDGCNKEGKFRAPKSPKDLDNFFWFCLGHVKEYNNRWNYFQNSRYWICCNNFTSFTIYLNFIWSRWFKHRWLFYYISRCSRCNYFRNCRCRRFSRKYNFKSWWWCTCIRCWFNIRCYKKSYIRW